MITLFISVVFYSFDGGKTYQTDNFYKISENKKIVIVLKDNEKRVVGKKKYGIAVKTGNPPSIIIENMPSSIYVGTNFNIGDYVKAVDSNNNSIPVTYSPQSIDTSNPGTHTITFNATDANGLTSTVSVEITVMANNNSNNYSQPAPAKTKTTYYRYRTKNTSKYKCNYYDCSELDHNDTTPSIFVFDNNSYCCSGDGCTKSDPLMYMDDLSTEIFLKKELEKTDNISLVASCSSANGDSCRRTNRYATYGNVCYDRSYLSMVLGLGYRNINAEPIDNPCNGGRGDVCKCDSYQGGWIVTCNSSIQRMDSTGYSAKYIMIKSDCEQGEININGACHKVDSVASNGCKTGYEMEDGKCYRKITKTCNNECNYDSWSEWSKWSTTKVVANSNTQVETKTE